MGVMIRKKRQFIFLLSVLMLTSIGYGQQLSKDEKKINKCWKVFNKSSFDSYAKGINKLKKYMNSQNSPSLFAYESLVSMEFRNYNRNSKLFNIELNVEKDGEKSDSLTKKFQNLMQDVYKDRFLDVCRLSTMQSTSPTGDLHLRKLLVSVNPDTTISEKGMEYFENAEKFFKDRDFELAEVNYRKALKTDTNYYKAYLYLGDSFWAREEYDSALVYYNIAKDMQPDLLEPRVFIIDALVEKGLYYRAKKECLDALMIYPGHDIKYKLQRILLIENKFMNERRFVRYFYPNDIQDKEQPKLAGDPFWSDYRAAKQKIVEYCNENGIIEGNTEVEDRYLEVYSIRTMLSKHQDDLPKYLHFADKMRQEGYLEPYVFISLFHVDVYPQFKDYISVEANQKKCKDFIEKYLVEST